MGEAGAPLTAAEQLDELKHELVAASRILVRHGVLDAFGHVSARHPRDPSRFLLPRSLAPALVQTGDVREFTMDGELAVPDRTSTFIERFIHSEIYKARPDVAAIVHSHAPGAVAASVVPGMPLRPVAHTCGFLGEGPPRFEIRDVRGGDSDLLIRNAALGQALAQKLAGHAVVLMRGHGLTAVAVSVAQAVYRAIYTEANARILVMACSLGEPLFLTPGEAAAAELTGTLQAERCWEVWKREVGLDATSDQEAR